MNIKWNIQWLAHGSGKFRVTT